MILKRAGKLPPDDLQNRPTRISWADRVGSGGMGALTSLPHPFLRGKGGGGGGAMVQYFGKSVYNSRKNSCQKI